MPCELLGKCEFLNPGGSLKDRIGARMLIDAEERFVSELRSGAFRDDAERMLIAVAGCMRGMQSGRSASAVGDAATSAVVTAIVMIVVSLAIFTVVFNALGI